MEVKSLLHYLILLVASVYVTAAISKCPEYCICDQRAVKCSGVHKSFDGLLVKIPPATHTLAINGSNFSYTRITMEVSIIFGLRHLLINGSNISDVDPNLFQHIPYLTTCRLSHNQLRYLKSRTFRYLLNLVVLDLRDNQLTGLEDYMFGELTRLRVLNLAHNELASLPNHVFHNLISLQELDLRGNRLIDIHPEVFATLRMLRVLNLSSNRLATLYQSTLAGLENLEVAELQDNYWDCSCKLEWLRLTLQSNTSVLYPNSSNIVCLSPLALQGRTVESCDPLNTVNCVRPAVHSNPSNYTVYFMHESILDCNVTGIPEPSIFWVTPRGILAHPDHLRYLPPEVPLHRDVVSYSAQPTYFESTLRALPNGSLVIKQMRHYFAGEFVCVAVNPAGSVNVTLTVSVGCLIRSYVTYSIVVGIACAVGFMLIGIVIGSIRTCCDIRERKPKSLEVSIDVEGSATSTDPPSSKDSPWLSPVESPIKCVTPAETRDAENNLSEMSNGIRDTLEDVRDRLRQGVGRHVDKMRTRAATVRDSSTKYIHSIKESSSTYLGTLRDTGSRQIKTIRETSSQAACKVRTGMVMGVEQVKYHVQSMKEFCGTGDMTHTISTISVSTDLDTDKTTQVVRIISYIK